MIKREQVIDSLKNVKDPEIGLDVWTLGLIYDIQIAGNGVISIKMTLTTPMCPFGPQLISDVKVNVGEIKGVSDVDVDLVFDPPWQASEDLKESMGLF